MGSDFSTRGEIFLPRKSVGRHSLYNKSRIPLPRDGPEYHLGIPGFCLCGRIGKQTSDSPGAPQPSRLAFATADSSSVSTACSTSRLGLQSGSRPARRPTGSRLETKHRWPRRNHGLDRRSQCALNSFRTPRGRSDPDGPMRSGSHFCREGRNGSAQIPVAQPATEGSGVEPIPTASKSIRSMSVRLAQSSADAPLRKVGPGVLAWRAGSHGGACCLPRGRTRACRPRHS